MNKLKKYTLKSYTSMIHEHFPVKPTILVQATLKFLNQVDQFVMKDENEN